MSFDPDAHSGVTPVDATTSSISNSSSNWDNDTKLIWFLMLMQLLLITAMGLLTLVLCCYIFRQKPRDGKEIAEILRIAEGSRRVRPVSAFVPAQV